MEPQYDAHLIVGAVDVPNEEKLGVAMLRNSPIELVPGVTGMLKGMGEAVEPGESADNDVEGRERLNGTDQLNECDLLNNVPRENADGLILPATKTRPTR